MLISVISFMAESHTLHNHELRTTNHDLQGHLLCPKMIKKSL